MRTATPKSTMAPASEMPRCIGAERQARTQSTAVANGMTRGQKRSTQRSSTGSATRMSSISVERST